MFKCIDPSNTEFRKQRFLYLEFMFELVKKDDAGIAERVKDYLEEQYRMFQHQLEPKTYELQM